MTPKRASTLAVAGASVSVLALLSGCAMKPGVAAVITPMTCGATGSTEEPAPTPERVDAQEWSCPSGSRVDRGDSTTITTSDLVGVQDDFGEAEIRNGSDLVETGAQTLDVMVVMLTVLRVADDEGIEVTDEQALDWLRQSQADSLGVGPDSATVVAWLDDNVGSGPDSGWLLWGRYNVLVERLAGLPDGGEAFQAAAGAALSAQDVEVNPRFGSFDPARLTVMPPVWATP